MPNQMNKPAKTLYDAMTPQQQEQDLKRRLRLAQVKPQLNEKRRLTLDFLEGSVMHGNEVKITPVKRTEIDDLSAETFEYLPTIETYITFDERPSVKLLRQYGWFKEDAEVQPIVAYLPTHLLYYKPQDGQQPMAKDVANFVKIDGDEYQSLVQTGESQNYILQPLRVTRGTIVDILYDFAPDATSKFYATDVKVDTVSINYVVNLMPYRYDKEPEGEEDFNTPQLSIDTRDQRL